MKRRRTWSCGGSISSEARVCSASEWPTCSAVINVGLAGARGVASAPTCRRSPSSPRPCSAAGCSARCQAAVSAGHQLQKGSTTTPWRSRRPARDRGRRPRSRRPELGAGNQGYRGAQLLDRSERVARAVDEECREYGGQASGWCAPVAAYPADGADRTATAALR